MRTCNTIIGYVAILLDHLMLFRLRGNPSRGMVKRVAWGLSPSPPHGQDRAAKVFRVLHVHNTYSSLRGIAPMYVKYYREVALLGSYSLVPRPKSTADYITATWKVRLFTCRIQRPYTPQSNHSGDIQWLVCPADAVPDVDGSHYRTKNFDLCARPTFHVAVM